MGLTAFSKRDFLLLLPESVLANPFLHLTRAVKICAVVPSAREAASNRQERTFDDRVAAYVTLGRGGPDDNCENNHPNKDIGPTVEPRPCSYQSTGRKSIWLGMLK